MVAKKVFISSITVSAELCGSKIKIEQLLLLCNTDSSISFDNAAYVSPFSYSLQEMHRLAASNQLVCMALACADASLMPRGFINALSHGGWCGKPLSLRLEYVAHHCYKQNMQTFGTSRSIAATVLLSSFTFM